MEPGEVVRLWDATAELARDESRDGELRRRALRQFFGAVTGPDEEMDAGLEELAETLEQLRD